MKVGFANSDQRVFYTCRETLWTSGSPGPALRCFCSDGTSFVKVKARTDIHRFYLMSDTQMIGGNWPKLLLRMHIKACTVP